jgi:hypothetical protein
VAAIPVTTINWLRTEMRNMPKPQRVHELRAFWPMFAAFTVGTLAITAVLARATWDQGTAWLPLAFEAVWLPFGLVRYRRVAYRVTVEADGLYADRLFEHVEIPWQRVSTIRLLRSRWNRNRVQQVVIEGIEGPTLNLIGLSDFDALIAQLREVQPSLIRE